MLLKRLTQACGVSGNEKEVRDIIIEEIKDHVDSYYVDKLGNIITYKKGKETGPKVMLAAHMDEVGLIVSSINESGLIKFKPVGGIDDRVLLSKVVYIGSNKVKGVIGSKPIHLQEPGERNSAIKYKQLYIDIGVKNKDQAERLVNIGDYVTFDPSFVEFGNSYIKSKALDDRVGCAVLIDILKKQWDCPIYGVFSVMEEIGLRGAGVAAYDIEPDIALVLEGTTCSDVPGLESHEQATMLGKGPAISLMDMTSYFNRDLREFITKVAKDNDIPYQYRKTTFGGNDAGKIHLTKEGVTVATISVPCRYIHSPVSVASLDDYHNCIKLLNLVLSEIEKGGFKHVR
jgi:putative aminopeptidase FrvX